MISAPHLFKIKLEDVTNLCNTILLPIVLQVYEFYKKSEKLKKKNLCITANKEVAKKVVYENLQRDNYYAHSTGTFRIQSNI